MSRDKASEKERTDPAPAPLSVRVPMAVKLTGISRSKLYEFIRDGELEIVKVGSSALVLMSSLHQLIESRRAR